MLNYGVQNPQQSKEIQARSRQTNLQRYGAENPAQSADVQKKIVRTNLQKYGVATPLQSETVKSKIRQTNLQRYGVENPSQSDEVKNKRRETFFREFGVEHPSQQHRTQEQIAITSSRKNFETFLKTFSAPPKPAHLCEELALTPAKINAYISEYDLHGLVDRFRSVYEKEIHSIFPTDFVNSRYVVDGLVFNFFRLNRIFYAVFFGICCGYFFAGSNIVNMSQRPFSYRRL